MQSNEDFGNPEKLSGPVSMGKYMTLLDSLQEMQDQLRAQRERHHKELRYLSQERRMERSIARRVVGLMFFLATAGWASLVYVLQATGGVQ